jgi:hypothetical protein
LWCCSCALTPPRLDRRSSPLNKHVPNTRTKKKIVTSPGTSDPSDPLERDNQTNQSDSLRREEQADIVLDHTSSTFLLVSSFTAEFLLCFPWLFSSVFYCLFIEEGHFSLFYPSTSARAASPKEEKEKERTRYRKNSKVTTSRVSFWCSSCCILLARSMRPPERHIE